MSLRALLVGEAYGEREAAHNHALVGPTGVELSLMLGQVGFAPYLGLRCPKCSNFVTFTKPSCPSCTRSIWPTELDLIAHWTRLRNDHQIGVTNVFNLHPPRNELGHFFADAREVPDLIRWKPSRKVGGAFLKREHFPEVERLWREIENLRPTVVVALGNAACWALLDKTKINELRGTFHWSKRCNVKVVATYHPAYVLRSYSDRSTVLADLDKARRESLYPEIRRPKRWFTIPYPDERGLAELEEWFVRPAEAYTSDIETKRGQISIIGFGRSRSDALVVPFHTDRGDMISTILRTQGLEPNKHGNSYWPDERMEVKVWKMCIQALKKANRKIGQNWLYDLSYFVRDGILPDVSAGFDDTMLWHHAEFPEMRKGLGHLASIYLDEINWKPLAHANALKRDE